MTKRLFGLFLLFFSPVAALAGEVMFEGYYVIKLEGKPIGYSIQRFEFDPKAKMFDSISFVRTKFGGKTSQESLRARANDKFEPVSYQYTSQIDNQLMSIDATFKGETMTLLKHDGKSPTAKKETYKIPKNTFLSTFLVYKLMQNKLALNEVYKYSGIAEEEGASYWGKAWLESRTERGPYTVFRVVNSFKGEKFISMLAAVPDPKRADFFIKGEALSSNSPAKNVEVELVDTPQKATEGQLVPNKILITLFGTMPTGKVNMLTSPPPKMIPSPVPAQTAPEPAAKEE
ncbi:MAG: hypothetical protein KF799_01740 [Bdellovibrionales bacterium]|nr:hypothetical protein [Bdellovibrionales bacterium]